jgi:CubicO group peptidase (beta-lactamase class C family)
MNMQKRSLSLQTLESIVLFIAFAPTGHPRVQQTTVDFSELEKVILAELKETNTPGASVAIVSRDKVIYAEGFGTANVETGAPVTPEMLFRLGSTTKMYSTAALVTLAEEGKLKLDLPIGTYVKGLSPKLAQLTAHQLIIESGIPFQRREFFRWPAMFGSLFIGIYVFD